MTRGFEKLTGFAQQAGRCLALTLCGSREGLGSFALEQRLLCGLQVGPGRNQFVDLGSFLAVQAVHNPCRHRWTA